MIEEFNDNVTIAEIIEMLFKKFEQFINNVWPSIINEIFILAIP